MKISIDTTLQDLSKQLVQAAADRKLNEVQLSPALAHPAQRGTLLALMEKEEKRLETAIGSIRASACSCRRSAVQETVQAQRTLHNTVHIIGQLLSSWVMPQDLGLENSAEDSEDVTAVEVLFSYKSEIRAVSVSPVFINRRASSNGASHQGWHMQNISFQAMNRLGSKLREADSSKVNSTDASGDKARPFCTSEWEVRHHPAKHEDLGWTHAVQEIFSSEEDVASEPLDAGVQVKLKCISSPLHQLSLAGFTAASRTAVSIGKEVLSDSLERLQELQQQENEVLRKAWVGMCDELQRHVNRKN